MTVPAAPYVLGDLHKSAVLEPVGNGYVMAEAAELRLDFADVGGGTYKPIYVGRAPTGTTTATAQWLIQRFTWTSYGPDWKPTRIQVLAGAWDDRASLGW
jgi:hypothetical protein